eukprot:6207435-Pleurochrysis_carterae.AAC.3
MAVVCELSRCPGWTTAREKRSSSRMDERGTISIIQMTSFIFELICEFCMTQRATCALWAEQTARRATPCDVRAQSNDAAVAVAVTIAVAAVFTASGFPISISQG